MRCVCVLAVVLVLAATGRAQDLRFQHLTVDDGLNDNAITCLHEDRMGFIWIGTESGLDRYDGSGVWNVPGIATHITAVLSDRAGVVWAATKTEGLLRVDPWSGHVRAFRTSDTTPAPLRSDLLTALYELDDSTLLIGEREHSLLFFDKRTGACSYWADSLDLSPKKARPTPAYAQGWCHTITPLNDTLLWIGFLHVGQSMLVDRRTLRTVQRLVIRRAGSETQTCAVLVGDTLFTGGWQNDVDALRVPKGRVPGFVQAEPMMRLPIADEVNVLLRWDGPYVLAASRGIGLFLVNTSNGAIQRFGRMRTVPSSLADDRIRALMKDRSGALWVATANGLDRFVPQVWSITRTELFSDPRQDHPELFFHRVEPDDDGGVRVFTSAGFFRVDAHGAVRHVPVEFQERELQPTFLGPVVNGGRLLGTEYGLVTWDEASGRITGLRKPTLVGTEYPVGGMYQVRGLDVVRKNDRDMIIAATLGYGVHAINAATDQIEGLAMLPSTGISAGQSLVNDLLADDQGRFWYATTDGIVGWSTNDPIIPPGPSMGAKGRTLAHGEDTRKLLTVGGQLWAITRSGSLLRATVDSVMRFDPPEHLRSGYHGATADRDGNIWVTTDNGLLRFKPQDASFTRIIVGDGASVRKLSRAIATLPDGRIVFCADNALFSFDPRAYDALPGLPVPYVQGASVAGRAWPLKDGLAVLSYRSGAIDIAVGALAHGFPTNAVLQYRLDGVEQEWRETQVRDVIRYAGMPVGEHRLRVRVRDAFGRISPEHVLLTVRVDGPVWQQWWFYAIALLVVSVGLYAFYNYRLSQALKLQAVRNRIASDLHDEVGSSLSSITIGAQLAARLSPDASEQLRTLLARMGETSSQSLRSISDIVWAIDPKNDEGEALVKRMRRIAQELLESKGVDVSFDVGIGVEDLKLPMNARKEIVLIFKEAVHNASKYSGASLVQVSLHRRSGTLAVSVKDDGKGFDVALHPDGHGLGSMKRRADTIGADLTLHSAHGMGTLVGVEVDLTRIRD